MRTIKLLSTQISEHWELIKYAVSRNYILDDKDMRAGLIWLLHELLSDRAQCWFRIDDKRQVVAIVVTRLEIDKRINKKTLFIYATFSYRVVPFEQWQKDFELLKEFARQEKCHNIATTVSLKNKRILEMDKALGFKEINTFLVCDLE